MQVFGNWLTNCATQDGAEFFLSLYDMTAQQMIEHYELENNATLTKDDVQAIVILESDSDVNQVFVLEDGDKVCVYAEGCCDTIFNTDGFAFMEVWNSGVLSGLYAIDNSPYQLVDACDMADNEDIDFTDLKEHLLKEYNLSRVTFENTIFIRQL
jgi:hypothetical protein